MKVNVLITLMLLFLSLSGCKVSFDKNITDPELYDGGIWGGGQIPGVYFNAKICLEGAGVIPMSTVLTTGNYLPYVTPYSLANPWLHFSSSDIALSSAAYIAFPWVDWVLVEVYIIESGEYIKVDAQSALLHQNGTLYSSTGTLGLYFSNLIPGNYYINIKHRNHLAIATQEAVSINIQNYNEVNPSIFDVDFTDPQTILSGDAASLGGDQCLAAGDVNNDNSINAADLSAINDKVNAIVTGAPDLTQLNGYFAADVNMDTIIRKDLSQSSTDHGIISTNVGLTTIVHPDVPVSP